MHRYGTHGWIGWSVALVVSLVIVGLALLPPFVSETARALVMQAFAGVCHQLPDRSPQIGGVALAVCDRCIGVYSGLAGGVLGFALVARWRADVYRHAGSVLAGALMPLTVDWAGPVLGLWANVPLSRVATGVVFGIAAGYLLACVAVQTSRPPDDRASADEDAVPARNAAPVR